MKITKYEIYNPLEIQVPSKKREWMDKTHNAFAYRCLPLTVANGFGWTVINPYKFLVVWNGGKEIKDVIVHHTNQNSKSIVQSHFGSSILTFNLGFLINTDLKHNLYVKGPANNPKRGISPLEGIIETDWLPFTFTMNWKITEENYPITFEEGEPICTFFPFERHYMEQWEPEIKNIKDNPSLNKKYEEWFTSRNIYNSTLSTNGNKGQRDYLHGQTKDGEKFHDHQIMIKSKEFKKVFTFSDSNVQCKDIMCSIDQNEILY